MAMDGSQGPNAAPELRAISTKGQVWALTVPQINPKKRATVFFMTER
jgi:hypothetical protein